MFLLSLFLGSFGFGELLVESVDTAVDGSASLFAGVEWVAICTGFNLELGSKSGSGGEGGSAADAGNLALVVLWVDVFLHFFTPFALALTFAKESSRLIIREGTCFRKQKVGLIVKIG